MGKALKIRGTDFSQIAIGNINDDIGDNKWLLKTHDYMNEFGPGGQINKGYWWYGEAFNGGANFFSGKHFTKIICRFQESEHGTETPETTANVLLGYTNIDGSNPTQLASVTALYNKVVEIPNGGITIPEGKTLYFYCTNMWLKTIDSEEINILNLPKGINLLGDNQQVLNWTTISVMFDIYNDL